MRRGDLVPVVLPGEFGKPRPSIVVQADLFDAHPTVTILPVTSTLVQAPLLRITLTPSEQNGLQAVSQIMIDKAMTVRRETLGDPFGRIDPIKLQELERCLAVFLGIAD